ncbi:lytic transglycosylase domain-containing protein [Sphingomonas sp. HF-S3]|uniref:Lytic transglycosylase domain-containing protein n=1 Tax=Sphingomonas rustica TaxID=3103142 RepID=A0ABV0B378_9SPHN
MAALSLALLLLAGPVEVDETWRWSAQIDAAAARCGVPADWIARVMRFESGGRTSLNGRPIRSRKGAIGLMQLMPATWAELRRELGLGDDADLPADNIIAGACYLRRMYDRFGYPGAFAAYNAGPGRYAAWRAGTARLPAETVTYLTRVTGAPPALPESEPPAPPPLFLVRREVRATPLEPPAPPSGSTIFVLRREVP